jgi:large subunit ribosomal protein L20
MPRAQGNVPSRRRRQKYLKAAKGNFQGRRKLYRSARETVEKGWQYQYRDRRVRKREFRAMWIGRINAAARALGMPYSVFMAALKKSGIDLNRKMLSELAIRQPAEFQKILEAVRPVATRTTEPTLPLA